MRGWARHTGRRAPFATSKVTVRDPVACRVAGRDVDRVLRHAAVAAVPASVADPITSRHVNVGGFPHVLVAGRNATALRSRGACAPRRVSVRKHHERFTGRVRSRSAALRRGPTTSCMHGVREIARHARRPDGVTSTSQETTGFQRGVCCSPSALDREAPHAAALRHLR